MLPERVERRELTPARLAAALRRRLSSLPHQISWSAPSAASRRNRAYLARFANRHAGQRCFIVANGPSLAKMDLAPLREEVTFGLNRIYMFFDQISFRPTYYCAINELVLRQFADEIRALPMPKFLNWSLRDRFGPPSETTHFLRDTLGVHDYFSTDPRRGTCSGGTVTYVALQLAYFMGFHQVILIGADHSFVEQGTPNSVQVQSSEFDLNHFHPAYFPQGVLWQLPDLHRSEGAYRLARAAFEADGRQVLDATLGGELRVFPKVDFASTIDG